MKTPHANRSDRREKRCRVDGALHRPASEGKEKEQEVAARGQMKDSKEQM